jgi:hypothetical protein
LERLKEKRYEVTGFFYNPNIHPYAEYQKRRQAVEDYSKGLNFDVIYPEYAPSEYFREINRKENNPGRCSLCWTFRMKATAKTAKENGFKFFSTTLLVSPYQDQELLRQIGEAVSQVEGVDFYYEDFRPGFRSAHNLAREKGIYCQNYCGCIYSEIERHNKKK